MFFRNLIRDKERGLRSYRARYKMFGNDMYVNRTGKRQTFDPGEFLDHITKIVIWKGTGENLVFCL